MRTRKTRTRGGHIGAAEEIPLTWVRRHCLETVSLGRLPQALNNHFPLAPSSQVTFPTRSTLRPVATRLTPLTTIAECTIDLSIPSDLPIRPPRPDTDPRDMEPVPMADTSTPTRPADTDRPDTGLARTAVTSTPTRQSVVRDNRRKGCSTLALQVCRG